MMSTKKFFIVTFVILTGIILYVFVPEFKITPISKKEKWFEVFELSNGMQVVYVPNHKIPAATHMIWYKLGAMDEPLGKSGIAHFLEHLMFKGTKKFPDGEFSRQVALNGGQENAFTGQDFTAYYQNIAIEKLPLVMEMEADRMRGLVLTEEQILSERSVIIEERNSRIENSPRAILFEQMDAALFQNHPYKIPIIGWKHEIAQLNRKDALEFYNKYYNPANAYLIVGGDIGRAELQNLAEKYYGSIPAGKEAEFVNVTEPQQRAPKIVTLEDERVKSPELWITYQAPGFIYGETKYAYAAQLLSRIMGGTNISRLYKDMVIDKKIAVVAGSDYSAFRRGPGEFTLYALPAEKVSVEKLEKALMAEVKKIIEKGVTDAELESAKKAMVNEMVYSREGLQQMSYTLGQVIAIGLDPSFVMHWEDNLKKVTKEEVQEAAKYIFEQKAKVTGVLKDEN